MGILSAMSGNAGEMTPAEAQQQLQPLLIEQEQIHRAFHVGRDMFAFSDRRLILVDKQGMTGSKVEYRSIPYRVITNFSIETAGNFDMDAEMKIWISGNPIPVSKEFNKKVNVYEVQQLLAHFVCR
ncbi:MAG: PH domain-containing protein [Ilumatobacteraceae bacterium]